MDDRTFDLLARELGSSRRRLLIIGGAGALAIASGMAGMTSPLTETADAKKKKKKKKKSTPSSRCVYNSEPCTVSSDCCDGNCGINRVGASICCSDFDELCTSDADCCGEMRCTAGSRCI